MGDYDKFCPVALGSEVLADRWTPLILRELILGNSRFNDIARGLPGISRSLLTQRLRHLERKGVLEHWPSEHGRAGEYRLTPAGKDLEPVVMAIGRWAVQWLHSEIDAHEVDAVTLMWWMHRLVVPDRLPSGRVVVEFVHSAPQRATIWLVFDRGAVSVCLRHPGFDSDLVVTAATSTLAAVFGGAAGWAREVASGTITVAGPTRLVRALPTWFAWSPFAPDVRRRETLGRPTPLASVT